MPHVYWIAGATPDTYDPLNEHIEELTQYREARHAELRTWDDLRVSLARGQVGATNPPTFGEFRTGIYAYSFASSGVDALYFDCQMPHDWAAGSGIRPHIHWSPGNSTDTGAVVWKLDYSLSNPVNGPDNTFPAPTTLSVTDAADGTAYKHQIAPWSEIDMAGYRESCILMCRVYRDGSDEADTFTDVAWGLSLDFHYQREPFGSEDEYPT